MKKLLTVNELADLLTINQLTVRRMVKRGQLAAVRIGRAVRFDPDDVDTFLASVRVTETPKLKAAVPIPTKATAAKPGKGGRT